jgi:hypothetical protein
MNATLRASAPPGRIEFANGKQHRDGYFTCVAVIEIDGEEWPAIELGMIDHYRADMLGFVEELAQGASTGWEGDNGWESEFSQLHLAATSNGDGEVNFRIYARWKPEFEEIRRGEMKVPADAVRRFGVRMRDFLRLEQGSRFSGNHRRGFA